MDEGLKRQAESLFDAMGMNMTTAFTIFTKAVVREGRIPFEIRVDPFYSETNIARLISAARDMDAGVHCQVHDLILEDCPSGQSSAREQVSCSPAKPVAFRDGPYEVQDD